MKIFATGWSENFDGPGLRWVIYLKGCNFCCPWCASPESIDVKTNLLFYAEHAEQADKACPRGAVTKHQDKWNIDRNTCISCQNNFCTTIWQHPAFEHVGTEMSVAAIVKQAQQYRSLFGTEGGITFGGGEPTLQAKELLRALAALRQKHIHTAMETNASYPALNDFYNKVDLLICDLKCVSAKLHQKWIGASNSQVLKNLKTAAKQQHDLLIRIPFITGMNDTKAEKQRIMEFLIKLRQLRDNLNVQVLRLHHLGEPKYRALGKTYSMADVPPPNKTKTQQFIKQMCQYGINATLGG